MELSDVIGDKPIKVLVDVSETVRNLIIIIVIGLVTMTFVIAANMKNKKI